MGVRHGAGRRRWLAAFLENHGLGQRGRCGAGFVASLAAAFVPTVYQYVVGRIMYRVSQMVSF